MIFFEPKELLDLAEGERGFSLPNLILGKRIEVQGGNAADHKWLSRFTKGQTRLTTRDTVKFTRLMSDKIPLPPMELEEMTSGVLASQLHVLPWYSFIYGANTVASGQFEHQIPRTLDLVLKLDILSKAAKNCARTDNLDGLLQIVSELPITSTLVPDWVCGRLKSSNHQNWNATFFPLRVVSLFAMLLHMSSEADKNNGSDRPNVGQIFWSRDPETGGPRPFRPCFERLLEITGEATFDGLFKNINNGSEQTRIRQGRKYMAAPPHHPKAKACSAMLRSAEGIYDLNGSAIQEISMMFFFARMLTGIFLRCEKILNDVPGLGPNEVMDQFGVEWRLDETEDANILRQMDVVLAQLHSSSKRSSQSSGRSS